MNYVITCDQSTAELNSAQYDWFRVEDANQDGVWNYYRNDNLLGTYDLGTFVTGDPRANGERKTYHDDSAYADFKGLQRKINYSDWVNWDGTALIADNDPDYRLCIQGDIHVTVQAPPC